VDVTDIADGIDHALLLRRVKAVAIAMMSVQGVAFALFPPLLVYFSTLFHLSSLGSGIIVGFWMLGAVLGAALAPVLVNIFTLKPLAMIAVALSASGMLITGTADSVVVFSAGRVLGGVATALLWVTSFTWVLRVSDASEAPRGLAAVVGLSSVGNLVGPLIGPVAIKYGFDPVFFAVFALTLLLLVPMSRMPAPYRLGNPGNHIVLLFRTRVVRSAVMANLARSVAIGSSLVLLPLLLTRQGFASSHIAATYAVAAVLTVPFSDLLGSITSRFGPWPTLRVLLATIVLIPLTLPQVGSDPLIFALAAFLVGLTTASPVVFNDAFSAVAKPNPEAGIRQIELMSWSLMVAGIGQLVGAVMSGFLLNVGSYMLAFGVVAAVAMLVVARTSSAARAARDGEPIAA
jgi:MFS family permease